MDECESDVPIMMCDYLFIYFFFFQLMFYYVARHFSMGVYPQFQADFSDGRRASVHRQSKNYTKDFAMSGKSFCWMKNTEIIFLFWAIGRPVNVP